MSETTIPDSPNELRVLVVDDNTAAATSFCYLLQILGCRTAVAFDGATAVNVARLFQPHLSFIDLDMPEADGCAAAVAIRAQDPLRHQVLVCLTGRSEPEDAARATAAGFDVFLSKPMEPQPLAELLAQCKARLLPGDDLQQGAFRAE